MVLIDQAKKQRVKARESVSGKADGLNNRETLKALIRVFDPNYADPPETTFKQNVSAYRSCQMSQGTYLPFDQENLVTKFDTEVRSRYSVPLERMVGFVDRFIDTESGSQFLAGAVIGLILADQAISDTQEFFITSNGDTTAKNDMARMKRVELDALLLGTWHYVVTHVHDNKVGRSTFERWHHTPTVPNAQWRPNVSAFPHVDWPIQVSRSQTADTTESTGFAAEDPEIIEAEVIDDDNQNRQSAFSDGTEQIVADPRPTVTVFQGGTNNTNIGHVNTLNLGR